MNTTSRLFSLMLAALCIGAPIDSSHNALASSVDGKTYQHNCWVLHISPDRSGKGKECIIIASPVLSGGNYKKRGQAYLSVRNVSKKIDEVSVSTGYAVPDGEGPEMKVYRALQGCLNKKEISTCKTDVDYSQLDGILGAGCAKLLAQSQYGKCSTLVGKDHSDYYRFDISEDEQSWVKDSDIDSEIIEKMSKGNYAVIRAHSHKASCSVDVYSLVGFKDAYAQMKSICTPKIDR